jgi:hypothetical protein
MPDQLPQPYLKIGLGRANSEKQCQATFRIERCQRCNEHLQLKTAFYMATTSECLRDILFQVR